MEARVCGTNDDTTLKHVMLPPAVDTELGTRTYTRLPEILQAELITPIL